MKTDLFYSREEEEYYYSGEESCHRCHKQLTPVSWLVWDFMKKDFKDDLYCFDCRKSIKNTVGIYSETRKVHLRDRFDLPDDSVCVFPSRPSMSKSSQLSSFDVATRSLVGEKVVDRTIQSHNPDFMIDHSSKSQKMLTADMNDLKLLPVHDCDKMIDDVLSAVPIPPESGCSSVHKSLNIHDCFVLPTPTLPEDKKILEE